MLKDSVQLKTVSKLLKEDVQDALKTTKSTRTDFAHHSIQTVLLETFMRSVSDARMVFMLIQHPDAEFLLWVAIMLMVFVLHAELHSFIKDKLPLVSLMDANSTSLEVVRLVLNPTNSDTIHAS
jgi:hypothetical protein